ncbi:bestrophin family ion channel [Flavicella sp.]|uniref:bestrophin family protein n=1 Tax=Flavicella sp. TaxID=2957742 RepID=UPI002622F850|nr:bestrophin family ion channel [Flavicella sp.]MDG1805244.1 bestrophin family ion channel [Flavicella sp.]
MILEKRIPLSYWFKMIRFDMLIIAIFSSFVFILSLYLQHLTIPFSIVAFLGTAISLLLSFKLSQSYDRWWEARKIWGAIVNDSRSFVVQLKNFTDGANPEIVGRMGFRQMGWCYVLGNDLRKLESLDIAEQFVSKEELEVLKTSKNRALTLLDFHNKDLLELHKSKMINDYQQMQIDSTIVRLCASMGKAERIKNTFFPKTYRMTLHFFIYIFLISLSLSLTDLHNIVEIPFMMVISLPFFMLEKIAMTIQDPFENKPADTPVTSIARTIEINLKQLLGEEEIPEKMVSDTYYSL